MGPCALRMVPADRRLPRVSGDGPDAGEGEPGQRRAAPRERGWALRICYCFASGFPRVPQISHSEISHNNHVVIFLTPRPWCVLHFFSPAAVLHNNRSKGRPISRHAPSPFPGPPFSSPLGALRRVRQWHPMCRLVFSHAGRSPDALSPVRPKRARLLCVPANIPISRPTYAQPRAKHKNPGAILGRRLNRFPFHNLLATATCA